MKTFFEKLTTFPFPAARTSVAVASKSDKGAWSARRRAASRVMGWSGVRISKLARLRKEFNTECTENAEKRRSAEQVFRSGTDDAGRRLGHGLEAITTNENNREAFRFAHQEAGGGGEFVGDCENRCGQRLSLTVARTAQIEENRNA